MNNITYPKFSVLMPLYNGDKPLFFRRAIQSVVNNSCKPNQVVLVIDGPINKNLEVIISEFKDETFKIIRIKENRGIINALNKGIVECDFELIARCDSDDENFINRFELQLREFMNDEKLVLCGGQIIEIADGKKFYRNVPSSMTEISKFIRLRNPFNHMTVMYKKSAVIKAGKYPNILYREDYALWVKLFSMNKKLKNLNENIVFANAGIEMYKRRGKPKDILYEIKLQRFMHKNKIINPLQMFLNLIIRSLNMVVTPKIRGAIYSKFLRK